MPALDAVTWKDRAAIFVFASLSIASLLLYFLGVGRFRAVAPLLLAIEIVGLAAVALRARARQRTGVVRLLAAGLWAGAIATLAYDIVRVPLVHSSMPVFKAISYFGTVLLATDRPSVASEIAGWTYHLTNGVSFGLMYAALAVRPRAWSGVLWGLALEGMMLLTPYAEVFGYARDLRFTAVTVASHAVYGLVLWLALRSHPTLRLRRPAASATTGLLAVPIALGVMAADFHRVYASRLPPSPPPYMGRHLYTTWNIPEPDRLAVLWMTRRFVDPAAEFHCIEPFEKLRFGAPLDLPEAEIRRQTTQSATEVLVSRSAVVPRTAKIELLVRTTHLAEVSKWMLVGDPEAVMETEFLRGVAARHCGKKLRPGCLPPVFAELDRRYGGGAAP
jgi:hypothetical protein